MIHKSDQLFIPINSIFVPKYWKVTLTVPEYPRIPAVKLFSKIGRKEKKKKEISPINSSSSLAHFSEEKSDYSRSTI